jgi:hypothetical protein
VEESTGRASWRPSARTLAPFYHARCLAEDHQFARLPFRSVAPIIRREPAHAGQKVFRAVMRQRFLRRAAVIANVLHRKQKVVVAEDRYSHSPPPEIAEFPLRLQGAIVRMLKYRRNKLRRVLTVPPEPFPHGL